MTSDGKTIAISVDPARYGALATGRLVARLAGEPVTIDLTVPTTPVATEELLPVLHALTNVVMDRSTAAVEAEGRQVSCRAGCGACCRQLVPLPAAEARHVAALVEAMPEPRRSEVRGRFDAALARLDAAGLLAMLYDPEKAVGRSLGMDYLHLRIACPFLEDEACSIHPVRPLACREYLVTSSPEYCFEPEGETIDRVPVPAMVMRALRIAEDEQGWTPLVLALRHAERFPAPPPRPGTETIGAVIAALS